MATQQLTGLTGLTGLLAAVLALSPNPAAAAGAAAGAASHSAERTPQRASAQEPEQATKQDPNQAPPPKKFGTVFKDQVDGLIGALCRDAAANGKIADGSTLATAISLAAMGHCHRFYSLGDGPVVRRPVVALIGRRQPDGSFVNAGRDDAFETTGWVVEALKVLDPDEFTRTIAECERWLQQQGHERSSAWDRRVDVVRAAVARGATPLEVGASTARRAAFGPIRGDDGEVDFQASVDALVELVACQVVARELDRPDGAPTGAARAPTFSAAQQKGVNFLLTRQEDGVFMVETPGGPFPDPGLTGLGIAALETKPAALRTAAEQNVIAEGLTFLLSQQNDDGSFGRHVVNYTTSAAVLALSMAKREEFRPALERAQKFILALQNVEDRGYARADRDYGSIGYGDDQRGDLSNLQFAIEALRNTELDSNHEAFAKAIVFLQRTQNLRAVNDFDARVRGPEGEWHKVTSGDDGGSAYYPGNSPAGYFRLPDGTEIPRSYGSMTYAMLKTYTLAGVGKDDPRVRAAIDWLAKNWALTENPGADPLMDPKTRYQGLYYYYMVMAQALDVAGIDTLAGRDAQSDGAKPESVDWRAALRAHLEQLQAEDGSWLNDKNSRWWENQPVICTIYALLALERCAR